jgi:hypothetical protein
MTMKLKIIIFSMAAIIMTACGSDDDPNDFTPVEAQIYAELPGVEETRSDISAFSSGDKIGITGIYNSSTVMNNANLCYQYTGSGSAWSASSDENKFWFLNTSTVSFSAYYPYSSSVSSSGTLSIDDSDDYLYATGSGSCSSSGKVTLGNFSHCLSKVNFNFVAGNGLTSSDLTSKSFTVSSLKRSGTFNTRTGAVTLGSTTSDLSLSIGTSCSASANVLPQTATLKLKITLNDATYTATIGSVTFKAGYEYTYNITINRIGLTVSSCSINNTWTSGASASYTASKQYRIGAITSASSVGIGYFAYTDGSFDSKDIAVLTDKKKNNCKGIVFITGDSRSDIYVVGLEGGESEYNSSFWNSENIPSIAQFQVIYNNLSTLNSSLKKVGGDELWTNTYWTNEQDSDPEYSYAMAYNLSTGGKVWIRWSNVYNYTYDIRYVYNCNSF